MRRERAFVEQVGHAGSHMQVPPPMLWRQFQNRQHSLLHCGTGALRQAVVRHTGLGHATRSVWNLWLQGAQLPANQ